MASTHQTTAEKVDFLLLNDKITAEDFNGYNAVPDTLKEVIFKEWNNTYESLIKQQQQEIALKNIYYDTYTEIEDEDKIAYNKILNHLIKLAKLEGTTKPDGTKSTPNMATCVKHTAVYILELIENDKKKKEDDFKMKIEASKVSTSARRVSGNGKGSKKEKFVGKDNYVNTEDTAEGKDNKYFFKEDEDITFTKPTYVSKDKKSRNLSFKAVKSSRYLGGAKSKKDDKYCNGTIIWDRATGSKAIKKHISPAKFRARCGKLKVDGNDYCSACEKKHIDFFEDGMELGEKSRGYDDFDGMTYYDFITNHLDYGVPITSSSDEDIVETESDDDTQ